MIKMAKDNWDNITRDYNLTRFSTLGKIGGKNNLIKELKELGDTYNDTVSQLERRDLNIAKYKNTYFWFW